MTTRFSDYTTETNRYRTLQTALIVCGVMQRSGGWLTIKQVARRLRETLGQICHRTVRRYLNTLYSIGVLERKSDGTGAKDRHIYRWVGWPVLVA